MVGAEAESCCCCWRSQHDHDNTKQNALALSSCFLAHHTHTPMGRLCERLQSRQGELAKEADEEEHCRISRTAGPSTTRCNSQSPNRGARRPPSRSTRRYRPAHHPRAHTNQARSKTQRKSHTGHRPPTHPRLSQRCLQRRLHQRRRRRAITQHNRAPHIRYSPPPAASPAHTRRRLLRRL